MTSSLDNHDSAIDGKRQQYASEGINIYLLSIWHPIAQYILKRGHKYPLRILIAALILGSTPLALAAFQGCWDSVKKDLGYINQYLLALPVIVAAIGYYLGEFPNTIGKLSSLCNNKGDEKNWNAEIDYLNKASKHLLIISFPYLLGVSRVTIAIFYFWLHNKNEWYSFTFAGVVALIPIFLLYYLLGFLITRVFIINGILRVFFKKDISIKPLHPDLVGGLLPIGTFSMRLAGLSIFFGIFTTLGFLSISGEGQYNLPVHNPLNISMIVGYILMSGFVFFLPLQPAQNAMISSKHDTLKLITTRYNQVNQKVMTGLKDGNLRTDEYLSEIDVILRLYETVKKMPVWPFNFKTISSFAGSVLFPFLLILVKEVLIFIVNHVISRF